MQITERHVSVPSFRRAAVSTSARSALGHLGACAGAGCFGAKPYSKECKVMFYNLGLRKASNRYKKQRNGVAVQLLKAFEKGLTPQEPSSLTRDQTSIFERSQNSVSPDCEWLITMDFKHHSLQQ
uniref:Uncharacterized protein n=1 Tax=Romanomermis culicivorax TaxID=13658 RepID=A0A915K847_ROMCU